jgi:hypothetical protein
MLRYAFYDYSLAARLPGMTPAESVPGPVLQATEHLTRTLDADVGFARPAC